MKAFTYQRAAAVEDAAISVPRIVHETGGGVPVLRIAIRAVLTKRR